MQKIIEEKLCEIEKINNVKIIMAVESGSRAWGFESPDSDYDVRFVYVRKFEDYLKLEDIRDVIEWQLDETFDVVGWDIKKALKLLYKSNPTIFEWCSSPIIYRDSKEFKQFKKLIVNYFSMKKSIFHYMNMAESNYRTYLKTDEVRVKKYFYVLRPLLAAKWIINKKCNPPMKFSELMESELEPSLKSDVDRLLKMKKEMAELEMAPRIDVLNNYIENSLEIIKNYANNMKEEKFSWDRLNEYFSWVINNNN